MHFLLKSSNIHEKYKILRFVTIFRYLLIVVVVKYSLLKIQDGGNRKWQLSKSSSLSLLTAILKIVKCDISATV